MRSDPSAYAIRFQQLLFGTALLALGLFATRGMMRGGTGNMKMVVAGIIGVTVLLLMDRYYWMLWPLAAWGRGLLSVPMVDPVELGCIAVIGAHFVRRALRREEHNVFRPVVLLAAPYFVWAATSFLMNPTGIFLFGSRTIGARFYLKILLGFWTMMVLSVQRLNEEDCNRLVRCGILIVSLSFLLKGFGHQVAANEANTTSYELLGAVPLFFWLFSRYRLSAFMKPNWRPVAAVVLAAITLYTGKRKAGVTVGAFPLFRAFVSRQDRGLAVTVSAMAAVALTMIVWGQGRLFDLPISVQRTLSLLPGRWDKSIEVLEGGKDPFREIVHGYAWEEVRRNPWFGRKGFAMDMETLQWVSAAGERSGFAGHGISGNWHNTWIGMMADFGIPGAVFWALFSITLLVVGTRKLRACVDGSYQQTVTVFLVCSYWLTLLSSRTSGHSALVPFEQWPMFGLLLAITPPQEAAYLDRRRTPRADTPAAPYSVPV